MELVDVVYELVQVGGVCLAAPIRLACSYRPIVVVEDWPRARVRSYDSVRLNENVLFHCRNRRLLIFLITLLHNFLMLS